MKNKLWGLVGLGLACVPFACNAESTMDSTHIAYTENYFGLNSKAYESQLIIDDVKEYDKLTYTQNRKEYSGKVLLKKDAKIGGFDISANPITYVVNGDNVVSELPGQIDNNKYIITGDGSLTIYGVYLDGTDLLDSETIKTAYYGDTCVKDSAETCYYFKTKDDFIAKYENLKSLSFNKDMDSTLTSDDFVKGSNNASIKEDKDHRWITKDWINERITTDLNVIYNENGSVTFTSKKAEDKIFSLKSSLNVVFTSKSELDKAYVLKTNTINVVDLVVDGYTPISGYDINIYKGNEIVEMKNGEFEITIPIAVKYDKYVVAYVKDGKVIETLDATYNNGFVTFKTSHLSEYAVFGKNENSNDNTNNKANEVLGETEKNPQTGDNIFLSFTSLLLSSFALAFAGIKILKRK